MRRITHLAIAPLAGLALLAPTGAAHAATNPWSAYFQAKGVTCTSVAKHADGTTETSTDTVLAKSGRQVVVRDSNTGRQTLQLLSGGRMQETFSIRQRSGGVPMVLRGVVNYPSPAALAAHRSGTAQFTMVFTLPQGLAKQALQHGRTLTLVADYKVAGLGTSTVTLGDAAATPVEAVGMKFALRSARVHDAKPAFARGFLRSMRPVLVAMNDTDWAAKGRGIVLVNTTDDTGAPLTYTQTGCS